MRGLTRIAFILPALFLLLQLQGCGIGPDNGTLEFSSIGAYSAPPQYSELYDHVFQPKCLSCHSSGDPDFSSYGALMSGTTVVASNPSASSLYLEVHAGVMPKFSQELSDTDVQAIYDWIVNGAVASNPVAPTAPSGLAATAVSDTEIDLIWTDNSTDETGFTVQRATSSGGPYATVATLAANVTSYSSTLLTASTTYYYRVAAFSAAGSSSYTSSANATTQAAPTGPTAPSGLAAAAVSASEIDLTWTDNSSNETGFKVERSTSFAGAYSVIATLGAGVTSYPDTGLSTATTYYYRVYAYNGVGNSSSTSVESDQTYGTFTWLNANILQPKCASCHPGNGGFSVSSYANTMTRVSAGNSAGSLLYTRTLSGSMPSGGPALTAAEQNALKTWIDSGAANN